MNECVRRIGRNGWMDGLGGDIVRERVSREALEDCENFIIRG
jgi:hypothetical protein